MAPMNREDPSGQPNGRHDPRWLCRRTMCMTAFRPYVRSLDQDGLVPCCCPNCVQHGLSEGLESQLRRMA